MGWNTIKDIQNHNLFKGIDNEFGFYFVHSYYFECENEQNILTTSNYGSEFTLSIQIIFLEHNFIQKKAMETVYCYLKILLNYNYAKIKNYTLFINTK